jgi:hypothetical protein
LRLKGLVRAMGTFYNFDQPGVEPSEPVIANWWRQGMMGGAKAHWDCVSEFINRTGPRI